MRITEARLNNHRKCFELCVDGKSLSFPYAKADVPPTTEDPVVRLLIDTEELGGHGLTYYLRSGAEGTVMADWVLEYNLDPDYMRDALLYRLTCEAQDRMETSPISKREIIRRLGTSAAQFYRLIDQTNYTKSVDAMLALLHVLDCSVDLVVTDNEFVRRTG